LLETVDARTAIGNADFHHFAAGFRAHSDWRPISRILRGIFHQMDQYFRNALQIDPNFGKCVRDLKP